ncbi:MAG: hypothetical protein IT495_17985, partial [Gammaproteobacteria bacterium]|nr:hypothetical protein [Gammaproteobacteria bacterium]
MRVSLAPRFAGRSFFWALMAGLLLPAAVYLLFAPGLTGGFIFDDYANIVENVYLAAAGGSVPERLLLAAQSTEAGPLGRPIAMMSFALNHAASGFSPTAYKITNLAIHAVNALLVYL